MVRLHHKEVLLSVYKRKSLCCGTKHNTQVTDERINLSLQDHVDRCRHNNYGSTISAAISLVQEQVIHSMGRPGLPLGRQPASW